METNRFFQFSPYKALFLPVANALQATLRINLSSDSNMQLIRTGGTGVLLTLLPVLALAFLIPYVRGQTTTLKNLTKCKGYKASNFRNNGWGLTADLTLVGNGCAAYGEDLKKLSLTVEYQTDDRVRVLIQDAAKKRYQIPESVLPQPPRGPHAPRRPNLKFEALSGTNGFGFKITRSGSKEVLFSTEGSPLVFEKQFLYLRTSLPKDPFLYGLGEHTDSFRLPTKNYIRTLWSRDSYGVPENSNLYGNHPIYFEQRKSGTHGVFLRNSNGMDIVIDETTKKGKKSNFLEYRVVGGVFDFTFIAGPTPQEVSRQYSEVVGKPAEVAYWGLGFHQCRYGYRDWIDVAGVVESYKEAKIPLETMWTDIDYMDRRRVFSVDPKRFPLHRMRQLVSKLHNDHQHYIVMVDPAVAAADYGAYNRGVEQGIFLKEQDGSLHLGVVWPGVTVYPDWFNPATQSYWTDEFARFFNKDTGVDIDGVWIDMNEPANFCDFPCEDPEQSAIDQNMPPTPPPVRPDPVPALPGFPNDKVEKREIDEPVQETAGVPSSAYKRFTRDLKTKFATVSRIFGRNPVAERASGFDKTQYESLLFPKYEIHNDAPSGILSDKTAHTDVQHANGLWEYDVHNLYGSMMSTFTRNAMLARRPGRRPFIITRSTFAGAGTEVGKWLGDNLSLWEHYRMSIASMLGFSAIYQVPLVGSDVCGFGGDTTETLCARWTTLGAFMPFFRNHNGDTSISQEFYRWDQSASAARWAIPLRYRLLDYLYTSLWHHHRTGIPSSATPLWFTYPRDQNTYSIDHQFFFGPSILVSPVLAENETSVEIYLPNDTFYTFPDLEKVPGKGKTVTLTDIPFDRIPLHVKGGSIIPLRVESAMTTFELRKKDFELVVAPDAHGLASGQLWVDDGDRLGGWKVGGGGSLVTFEAARGRLTARVVEGKGLQGVKIVRVRVAGERVKVREVRGGWDGSGVLTVDI